MILSRTPFAVAALAALALSCGDKKKEAPPLQISVEAASAFGRVRPDGLGGALVLDLDAVRKLGLGQGAGRGLEAGFLVDLAVDLLPALAADMKDPAAAGALARSAVLLRLGGEWAKAPSVQRVGLVAKVDPLQPDQAADGALVLLAVREAEQENRELVLALGAALRAASGRDLVRTEQGNLCSVREAVPELPFQVCIQSGPGLLALGTTKALAALATPSATPASREPGAVLSLRGLLPQVGKVELTVEGAGALRVAGSVQPDSPAIADGLEKGIRAGLQELDAQAEKRRAVTERALGELKGSVGKDSEAPSRLRGAVAGATVDKVLDPTGDYAALRKSVQVARQGQTVTAEVTVPEGQVRRLVRFDGGMTTVAMVGILSAIAIPNFVKYQCRSRTAEGEAALQAGWAAVARYRAAKGAFPARLDQLDLPTRGRYALCMRSGCTPPASPRVATACGEALAGMAGGPGAPALCAATDLFGDGKPDVWVIGAAGEPMHVRSACD